MPGVNQVLLIGTVMERGVTTRRLPSGTILARFSLAMTETWSHGQERVTCIEVECAGTTSDKARALRAGDLVCVEGRLGYRVWASGSRMAVWAGIIQVVHQAGSCGKVIPHRLQHPLA